MNRIMEAGFRRCRRLSVPNAKQLLSSIDTVLFDLDGTLWRGDTVFPHSVALVERLLSMGKQVGYVTNNSTRTHHETVKELHHRGFPIRNSELVICSARSTALHLAKLQSINTAFLVGPPSLASELAGVGIRSWTVDSDDIHPSPSTLQNTQVVVCGLDRTLNYRRLAVATEILMSNPDSLFVATNMDNTFPEKNGRFFPDCGSIVAALSMATNRQLDICIGKPSPLILDSITDRLSLDPSRCLMIGDRCDTDIEFASAIGAKSLMVLSGAGTVEDVRKNVTANLALRIPNFIADGPSQILQFIDC